MTDEVDSMKSERLGKRGILSIESQLVTILSHAGDRSDVSRLCQARISDRSGAEAKVEIVPGFEFHPDFGSLT